MKAGDFIHAEKEKISVPVMCFAGHCVCWTGAVIGEKGEREKERKREM